MDRIFKIGFLNDLFCGRSYIAAPAELSIPFLLDEKSTVVPVRLAGEQSGGERKVSYGDARSTQSERRVGLRWQAAFGSSDRLE
jgi:hypothetical protein